MTVQELNNNRNKDGIFSICNDSAGWFALSRDGVNMITFYEGKYTFTAKEEVTRYYKNEKSLAKRITQLLNRGY